MWLAVRGAVALAVLSAAFLVPGVGAARAADCWLLDKAALDQAQAQGRCRDVFARAAPEAKPAPARTAKAARRAPSRKAAAAPSLPESLERLGGSIKPAQGATGRTSNGGIDHLAYGRAERTPVQR